ncbi:MAG: NADP-dependent oxidoreductase [Patulibacter minatonensis]
MQAVQFDHYGDVDVLEVRTVPDPVAGPGEVVVAVRAAAINPGEIAIRTGFFEEQFPATFPLGQGSDFSGVVAQVGPGVEGIAVGDEVLGWTHDRASQAELVRVPADHLTAKPAALGWDVAATLFVAPLAGVAALEAVAPVAGEVIVVSGAAGGAGLTAAQLAVAGGVTTIGLASAGNHEWLRSRGVVPVAYGEGQAERIRAAADGRPIAAFVDTFGQGYADLALELGVPRSSISTIIDMPAVERLGITWSSSSELVSAERLGWLADLVARGTVEIPIQATYPLAEVRAAYTRLAERHGRGKIVLAP